jgi:hypothetical protein
MRVRAKFDARQRGDDRVSSVQYLKLDTGGRVPVVAGVDLPALQARTMLTDQQREALQSDLFAWRTPFILRFRVRRPGFPVAD